MKINKNFLFCLLFAPSRRYAFKICNVYCSLYISRSICILIAAFGFFIYNFNPFFMAIQHSPCDSSPPIRGIIKCGKYACYEINLHKSNIAINGEKISVNISTNIQQHQQCHDRVKGWEKKCSNVSCTTMMWRKWKSCNIRRVYVNLFMDGDNRQWKVIRLLFVFQFPILTFQKILLCYWIAFSLSLSLLTKISWNPK